jgi:hypothetical protein
MPHLSALPRFRAPWLAVLVGAVLPTGASAADVAPYLPDGTMLVVSFNVTQFLNAPLVRNGDGSHPLIQDATRALEGFGIEPGKDLDSIVIAIGSQVRASSMLMLLHGRFDPDKVRERIKERAKERKTDIEVLDEDGAAVFQFRLPPPGPNAKIALPNHFFLTALDGGNIALAVDRAALTEALAKKTGRRKSEVKPRVVELVGKIEPKETLSIVFVAPAGLDAGGPLNNLTTVTGGLTATESIQTDIHLDAKDTAGAKLLADNVRDGWAKVRDILPGLAALELGLDSKGQDAVKEMLATFKITTRQDGVDLSSMLSKELIDKLKRKTSQAIP